MKLFIALTILAVSVYAAEEQSSENAKTKRQLYGYSHGPIVAAPAYVAHAPSYVAHAPSYVAHAPAVVAAPVPRFASYAVSHHPAPAVVAHAPAVVAHAPLAYAHAPVGYAHAPVAYAHGPVAYHHFK